MSDSLLPHGLYSPWNSPGQITGVVSLSLLKCIFPIQGSNPGLPHCRWILYQVSHQGSPRILEWVAYPFSSGSSQSRNWTWVSWIAGGFFTSWATKLITARMCALVAQSCPLFVTPRTVALQAPLPMEFSRQEYCLTSIFLWCLPVGINAFESVVYGTIRFTGLYSMLQTIKTYCLMLMLNCIQYHF